MMALLLFCFACIMFLCLRKGKIQILLLFVTMHIYNKPKICMKPFVCKRLRMV